MCFELDIEKAERALEIQVRIGAEVIHAAQFTRKPVVTMGQKTRRNRLGRVRRFATRDVELPVWLLKAPMFPLAVLDRRHVSTYSIQIPPAFTGRLERQGQPPIDLAALVALGDRIEESAEGKELAYRIACGETLILEHGGATITIRYVRRRELIERPVLARERRAG